MKNYKAIKWFIVVCLTVCMVCGGIAQIIHEKHQDVQIAELQKQIAEYRTEKSGGGYIHSLFGRRI